MCLFQEVGAELDLGIYVFYWGIRRQRKGEGLQLDMQGFPQGDTLEPV